MLHTTNNMSLFLHDLLFRFVFSAHFPAVFQKFSKGALPPRTPVGGLRAPPKPPAHKNFARCARSNPRFARNIA